MARPAALAALLSAAAARTQVGYGPGRGLSKSTYAATHPIEGREFMMKRAPESNLS